MQGGMKKGIAAPPEASAAQPPVITLHTKHHPRASDIPLETIYRTPHRSVAQVWMWNISKYNRPNNFHVTVINEITGERFQLKRVI